MASAGMSSRRARRGGTKTGRTLSRKNRSSRKRPSLISVGRSRWVDAMTRIRRRLDGLRADRNRRAGNGPWPERCIQSCCDLRRRQREAKPQAGESKELAEDIQDSLSKRIQKSSKPMKNRGVRKAPFVVLIGADMPSILTEISFLSNPADEQMLKKPEQRQKVAEGLYQGVVSYLESMNSVMMNQPSKPGAGRPSAVAVEQSRNQN